MWTCVITICADVMIMVREAKMLSAAPNFGCHVALASARGGIKNTMADASASATTAAPAKAKWGDEPTDVSDAIAGLTQSMAETEPVEAEVDEPEAQKLDEKEGDEVIDGTSQNDALHAVTVDKFDSPQLALPPSLLKGLYEMNFVRPSRIQAISLPKIWAGRNLLAQSHNGTGKTACFVLGMLKQCTGEPKPQALCLCPTRELAKQISAEVAKMGKHHLVEAGLSIKTILREERYEKGQSMTEQIVIGTPGKVWTLIGMRVLDTSMIKVFVLDEVRIIRTHAAATQPVAACSSSITALTTSLSSCLCVCTRRRTRC